MGAENRTECSKMWHKDWWFSTFDNTYLESF